MTFLPEDQMADIHILRQDYARALNQHEADPTHLGKYQALTAVVARRARAIRMIHDEDKMSVRNLSSMFRCSKAVIREALGNYVE